MLIAPDLTYINGALQPGLGVTIQNGVVTDVGPLAGTPDRRVHVLMPGCADLQVNGGGGVMLNSDPSPAGLRAIRDAHAGLGTTAVMPTVITDRPDVTEAAARAAIETRGEDGILGLHIEGPHINAERKGTHNPDLIRPLDGHTLGLLRDLRAADVRVILTLAPELADPALMAEARDLGVILSAGHTMANAQQTAQALEDGVTMFTHLYNAMPQMTSRDPGIIAEAVLSDSWIGIIADGIHVSWQMLRIALAARPQDDRTFIVSDAMATVGGPDHFNLYGADIFVRDGRLVNAQGSLAGAHIDMVTSLANLHHHAQVPLAQAIAMATDIPRRAVGAPPVQVAAGTPAHELIVLDEGLTLGAGLQLS